MSFFITLPSNGSSKYFSDNKITNYKIKLPSKLRFLPGEYEVALVDATYICSLKTLTGKNFDNILYIKDLYKSVWQGEICLTHFSEIEHLIHAINETLSVRVGCKFHFDKLKNRVWIKLSSAVFLEISEKLSDILGYDGNRIFGEEHEDGAFYAKFAPDLLGGRYHMYIYSDIVQPQIVGSSLVPLLRMINITGKEGVAITNSFQNPYYLQLSRNEIEVISIVICNKLGEELQIDKGAVTLTLHFRRVVGLKR